MLWLPPVFFVDFNNPGGDTFVFSPFFMSLRHPIAANVVQFCKGAHLHVCTRLVINSMYQLPGFHECFYNS